MYLQLTPEEERFQYEVHQFLMEQNIEEVIRGFELANSWEEVGEESRQFLQKLVQKGWLTISWPKEFGGQDKSNALLFILMNELSYFEMSPSDFAAGIGSSFIFGPLLMRYGTNEVKRELLPSVAKCEIGFCLGWSEPDSGSDLASVKTRAEDKGDHYLVNGQKIFGTATHFATHQVFLARTNPNVPKHRGLSVMMTELNSPGITISPLWTMGNHRLNEVYFDNVKVPKKYLLGKENEGWKFTVEELDLERMLEPGNIKRILDELVQYVKGTNRNGKLLAKDPFIRQELAELAIEFEIANLLFMNIASILDEGKIPSNEISMEKVFVSELWYRAADLGTQILGLEGILEEDSKWARFNGLITRQYQRSIGRTIYMGTSEIQRNIVATRRLGLPRG